MTLTLSAADVPSLKGDVATVDASIAQHLPEGLAYSGLERTGDGGLTTTFTLDFATPDEYEKKAKALLAAGWNTGADVEFMIADSFLLKGVSLTETYTSYGLLKWMFDGLVADGIVAQSDAGNAYEIGSSTLTIDGTSTSQSGSFNFSNVVDNGFDSVFMETDISDPDNITRTITYYAGAAPIELYKEYFDTARPAGAELDEVADGAWTMSFSGDENEVSAFTDEALDSSGSKLVITSSPGETDPATATITVVDEASCDALCSPGGGRFVDTLSATGGYAPASVEVGLSAGEPVSFQLSPPITSATTQVSFGLFGEVTATTRFVVDNDSINAVGDGFTQLFTPSKDAGSLTVDRGEKETTFTATVRAASVEALAPLLAEWAPGSSVTVSPQSGGNFLWNNNLYEVSLTLAGITQSHEVGKTTTEVSLPFGQSATPGAGLTSAGGLIPAFAASGPSPAGLIAVAVLILIIASAIWVLVRHPRQTGVVVSRLVARLDKATAVTSPLFERPVAEPADGTFGSVLGAPQNRPPVPSTLNLSLFRIPAAPAAPAALLLLARPQFATPHTSSRSLFDLRPTPTQGR